MRRQQEWGAEIIGCASKAAAEKSMGRRQSPCLRPVGDHSGDLPAAETAVADIPFKCLQYHMV